MAELAKHAAPAASRHTTQASVKQSGGPQTSGTGPQASAFKVFTTSLINSNCPGCGQATVNEPSVANSGRFVVETSNWNIAYTTNGGAASPTWRNQNPYTLSNGFCCDQEITYDPGHDIFLLLQLDYAGEGASTNGFTVSVAHGRTPTSWCTYKFTGANFGEGATDTLDFPKIAVGNSDAYVTWNDYPPNSGFAASGLGRLPLDSLALCSGLSYNYITRNTEFTFALANGNSALDTFYWVSNWFLDGTTTGSNMRIFSWPENSGSYSWVTRAINPFNASTVACGSPNWCSRLDIRSESVVITRAEYRGQANSAFAGDTILEVAGTAGPSSFDSTNYVVYNYFKLNSLSYIGNDQTYNSSITFAYPSCAVNNHGYVGCAMAQGTTAPGGLVVLQDATNPTQPWGYNFAIGQINGASAWGDYTVTSPFNPVVGPFQTVLWNVNSSGAVQPYYVVFGRQHDSYGYNRWKGF